MGRGTLGARECNCGTCVGAMIGGFVGMALGAGMGAGVGVAVGDAVGLEFRQGGVVGGVVGGGVGFCVGMFMGAGFGVELSWKTIHWFSRHCVNFALFAVIAAGFCMWAAGAIELLLSENNAGTPASCSIVKLDTSPCFNKGKCRTCEMVTFTVNVETNGAAITTALGNEYNKTAIIRGICQDSFKSHNMKRDVYPIGSQHVCYYDSGEDVVSTMYWEKTDNVTFWILVFVGMVLCPGIPLVLTCFLCAGALDPFIFSKEDREANMQLRAVHGQYRVA